MRAIQVNALTGTDGVRVDEVPEPTRGADEVLLDVRAVGLNWPDVLRTRGTGFTKPELPFLLGVDLAGVVVEAPEESTLRPGDRVAAFVYGGAGAERAVAKEIHTFPLPAALTFAQGAAMPVNYMTAEFILGLRGDVTATDRVLINGAGGGLGVAMIQVARALGAEVIGVVSSAEKAAHAKEAGAQHVLQVDDVPDAVKELTGGTGVDVVVDIVGGDQHVDYLRSLRKFGRYLVVGFVAGIPEVKLNRVLINNVDVRGASWGAYTSEHPEHLRHQWRELMKMVEGGHVAPLISTVHPLADAVKALEDIEHRRATGKVIVEIGDAGA